MANEGGDVLAILAAGSSTRFGTQDKLTAPLNGKMLGLHIAENVNAISFANRLVIAADPGHPCIDQWRAMGYSIIINDHAELGQSTSVAMAAKAAEELNADSLCICLADMPFVTVAHMQRLFKTFEDNRRSGVVASMSSDSAKPPAIFPAKHLAELEKLEGDHGARSLLQTAKLVKAQEPILTDIDTPELLEKFNQKKG